MIYLRLSVRGNSTRYWLHNMKVACIQMCSGADPAANLVAASALIREAAAGGAKLIATPEMTGLLQRKSKLFWQAVKTEADDPLIPAFSALARELKVTLLIGSLAVKTGAARAANRSFLFGPDGELITTYDKIHLFDVDLGRGDTWKESALYDGGDRAVLARTQEANIGLTICYDVRFASLYRVLAQAGAQIIAVPAAFTRPTGEAHWEALIRARGIETGSFIMAPAQVGEHEDGRKTWGQSLIIDPWGCVLAKAGTDAPAIISAQIDLDDCQTARQKIPAWNLEAPFKPPYITP